MIKDHVVICVKSTEPIDCCTSFYILNKTKVIFDIQKLLLVAVLSHVHILLLFRCYVLNTLRCPLCSRSSFGDPFLICFITIHLVLMHVFLSPAHTRNTIFEVV